MRIPFLPFNRLEEAFRDRDSLMNLFSVPKVNEAVYVASPVLHGEICKAMADTSATEKDKTRMENSLARYICRMVTRCTPFGLFAGCAVGSIGHETEIEVGEGIVRHARLDMDYLYRLYSEMVRIPDIQRTIRYYPNTTIYHVGSKLRYIEMRFIGEEREYHVVEVEPNLYLRRALKAAGNGVTADGLAKTLTGKGVDAETARDFVRTLIEEQILLPEMNQSIVGPDFLGRIIKLAERSGDASALAGQLKEIESEICVMNSTAAFSVDGYRKIEGVVKDINVPYDKSRLFQVDCSFDVRRATLGDDVVEETRRTMSFLNRLYGFRGNATIDKFRRDFQERYETREIPLMVALDPEAGIGYPSGIHSPNESPLIRNYMQLQGSGDREVRLSGVEYMLLRKVLEGKGQARTITLTDDDVKGSAEDWSAYPSTLSAMIELYKDEDGRYVRFISAGGGSAANLISRFAHISDDLYDVVESIVDYEQASEPDKCVAEIVHLPEGRTGNILARPDIRGYKILYMASPTGDAHEIPVNDIMLSVKGNRLVMRSGRLNMEIVPHLTSAHNYTLRTMPVYKFLCDMQQQAGLSFSWGALDIILDYKPRVMYGRSILSPASWKVERREIEKWLDAEDDAGLLDLISEWRGMRGIPDTVLLADGDNKLFVDLGMPVSVRSFLSAVHRRPSFMLEESLLSEESLAVKGKDGAYANQIIIPYIKE